MAGAAADGQAHDLLWELQGMAMAACEEGFEAYARMCLDLRERLKPVQRTGVISLGSLELLCAWAASADRYLRRPASPGDVADLVACLSALPWGPSMSPAEQNNWFRLLLWST